ncbi:FeoA domain protein [compost metagenome]
MSIGISLLKLKPGSTGQLMSLDALDPLVHRRLTDMGVRTGATIRLHKITPLGGPVIIECNGQLIGLRQKQAGHMEVCPA